MVRPSGRATSHVPPLKAWWPRLRRPAKPVGAYSAWNCSCSPTARLSVQRGLPRPHDTGMVTMASQRLSEFALHARAILGLPITPEHVALTIPAGSVAASHAIVVAGDGEAEFTDVAAALAEPGTDLRIPAKPEVHGHRRMAVALAVGRSPKPTPVQGGPRGPGAPTIAGGVVRRPGCSFGVSASILLPCGSGTKQLMASLLVPFRHSRCRVYMAEESCCVSSTNMCVFAPGSSADACMPEGCADAGDALVGTWPDAAQPDSPCTQQRVAVGMPAACGHARRPSSLGRHAECCCSPRLVPFYR